MERFFGRHALEAWAAKVLDYACAPCVISTVRVPYAGTAARARSTLVFGQERAEAGHAILDAVVAQRIPVCRRVDGDDRFVEPELRHRGDAGAGKVGADLHDGVDLAAVHALERVAQLLRRHFGDRSR